MSIDRIYKALTSAVQWQNDPDLPDYNPQPLQTYKLAENATETAFLVGPVALTDWDAIGTIVGSWDRDTGLQEGQSFDENGDVIGTPTHPVTADYAAWIRPLGNADGRATGLLDSPRWAGHQKQAGGAKYLEDDQRYTATDSPFTLKIIREDLTGEPTFPGWGWNVQMISDDPQRDITARAVGIYSDPDCNTGSFLYTTGAFIQDGSHDNNYYTECPVGQRQPTDAQVNFALLLGSAQEGYFNLPEGSSTTDALFWSKDQPVPGEEWEPGVAYTAGTEVTYLGILYNCLQSHTSQVGWEPPNVPALWAVV